MRAGIFTTGIIDVIVANSVVLADGLIIAKCEAVQHIQKEEDYFHNVMIDGGWTTKFKVHHSPSLVLEHIDINLSLFFITIPPPLLSLFNSKINSPPHEKSYYVYFFCSCLSLAGPGFAYEDWKSCNSLGWDSRSIVVYLKVL